MVDHFALTRRNIVHELDGLDCANGTFFAVIASALLFLIFAGAETADSGGEGLVAHGNDARDRFFVSLLGAAFIHLFWLSLTDWPVLYASGLAMLWLVAVMAKG